MASEKNGTPETEDDLAGAAEETVQKAQFNVLGQYIKDFSFECPNSPTILKGPGENPNLQISVNVNAEKMGDDEYEVVLSFEGHAKNDVGTIYNIELEYGGVFRLHNIPENALRPLLLIDCPALLFPFVRRIVSDVTRDGGFPPLNLDPIDFAGLYRANLEKESAGGSNLVN